MNFKVTTATQGKDLLVTVNGYLNENAVFPEFKDEIPGKIVINLSRLLMINSLGSRRWFQWLKTLRTSGGIVLIECSTAFIAQVNILHNFLPESVHVESFQIPYRCPKCTHEEMVLYQTSSKQEVPDTRPCVACDGQAELDIVRSKYFSFLNHKAS